MTKMNRTHPKLKKTQRAAKKRCCTDHTLARYDRRRRKYFRRVRHEESRGTWKLPNWVPGRLLAASKVRAR